MAPRTWALAVAVASVLACDAQTATDVIDPAYTFVLGNAVFEHQTGGDPLSEATNFCDRHAPANSTDCVESILNAMDSVNWLASTSEGEYGAEAEAEAAFEAEVEAEAVDAGYGEATTDEAAFEAAESAGAAAAAAAAGAATEEAAPEEQALSFTVQIDTEGGTAEFVHAWGADTKTEVDAFCRAHVGAADVETCASSLFGAVAPQIELVEKAGSLEKAQAEAKEKQREMVDKLFSRAATLPIQTTTDSKPIDFVHAAGADVLEEATAFCETHVPQLDSATCIETLVTAMTKELVNKEAAEGGAAGGAGGAAGSVANGASPLVAMLGPTLHKVVESAGGKAIEAVDTAQALKGKTVALYFAADWCPPCRQFTPTLAKFYDRVRNFRHKNLEVVWVSASRDESGFNGYFGQMPWLAQPFAERQLFEQLRATYKVKSFPTLVFVDGHTGRVIAANGRELVANDPMGEGFPYTNPVDMVKKVLVSIWRVVVPPSVRAKISQHPLVAKIAQFS